MKLNVGQPIVNDNLTMSDAFRTWTQLTNLSNAILHNGNPEGVVIADQYQFLINTAGTSGSLLYIKKLADIGGNKSQGWVAV